MGLDYERFVRVLGRCGEVATEPGIEASIARVHGDTLAAPAQAYLDAHKQLQKAEGAAAKETAESREALLLFDKPFSSARAVVAAYQPHISLPDTLKSQPTDTDKVNAIELLLDTVEDFQAEGWAADILAGEFGRKAPDTVREVNEAIAANKELSAARDARAAAYGIAWERYLAFKRVVRHVKGRTSPQYRRIHLRASASGDDAGAPTGGGTPPAGGST